MTITADSLMSLEAYAKHRKENKPRIIAHRKLRSVALGDHMTLQFEDETTIRYQIQEMLRASASAKRASANRSTASSEASGRMSTAGSKS